MKIRTAAMILFTIFGSCLSIALGRPLITTGTRETPASFSLTDLGRANIASRPGVSVNESNEVVTQFHGRSFVWAAGVRTEIGSLGGRVTCAVRIGKTGHIV